MSRNPALFITFAWKKRYIGNQFAIANEGEIQPDEYSNASKQLLPFSVLAPKGKDENFARKVAHKYYSQLIALPEDFKLVVQTSEPAENSTKFNPEMARN